MKQFKHSIIKFFEKYLYPILFELDLNRMVIRNQKEVQFDLYDLKCFDNTKFPVKGDHFFIFGGGFSINQLGPVEFNFIKKNTSIGLNKFFAHQFQTDLHLIEGFRDNEVQSKDYQWFMDNSRALINGEMVILIKDANHSNIEYLRLQTLETRMKEKIYKLPKLEIPGRSNESVKKSLKRFYNRNLHNEYFLFSRSSVSTAISIGYRLGFKKIVLIGFDMNNGKYFFHRKGFPKNPNVTTPVESYQTINGLHSTVNPTINCVTVDKTIYSLKSEILEPSGVELFVANKDSKLSDNLPIFNWPVESKKIIYS